LFPANLSSGSPIHNLSAKIIIVVSLSVLLCIADTIYADRASKALTGEQHEHDQRIAPPTDSNSASPIRGLSFLGSALLFQQFLNMFTFSIVRGLSMQKLFVSRIRQM
jgi:hypothetical protein